MRILWVKADKLLPVHNGGNIRSFHILRALAKDHEVTYFSYYGGGRDLAYEQELGEQLPGAICVNTEARELSGFGRGIDYLASVWGAAPYAVSRFRSKRVQERLQTCLAQGFDVAVCDFLDAAINFLKQRNVPTVLFQHNVESEIWRRHALAESNPLKKQLYRIEHRKMLRYERRLVEQFDHVIAVSENDRRLMSAWVHASDISVVPTGVDLEQYHPDDSARQLESLVVFVGAMDWEPNIDGVEYFCAEIWPKVLASVPSAKFRIVGRNPGRRIQDLACASVEVTGSVSSVVEHLRQAAVVVVPLRVGGGTRLKIYEAMATGRAVVSTAVGAEGLEFHDGTDIVVKDNPQEFAQSIVHLVRDSASRVALERAAARQAAKFSWGQIGQVFASRLADVVADFDNEASRPEHPARVRLKANEVGYRG